MKTLSDYLMEHGILKNQDAVKMAKEITEMFGLEAQHVREWYSVRLERLSQFIRDEIPEPQKTRYFAIIANGTADPLEPPTYASQMNVLRNEKEQAEAACAELQKWVAETVENCSVFKAPPSLDCGKGLLDKIQRLREALAPFAACEIESFDRVPDQNAYLWKPQQTTRELPGISIAHIKAAKQVLEKTK